MLVKTIQNREVLECLQKNMIHYAKSTAVDNLIKPYNRMMEHYGWTHSPVFGCAVGKRCEYYGARTTDAVVLTLDVPDDVVKCQVYYDWVDVIFFTMYFNEWSGGEFDVFVNNVLNGVGIDNPRSAIQVTMPYIKPEWLVSYEPINDEFIDNYVGSGGQNILK